jgi:hypothetical protein
MIFQGKKREKIIIIIKIRKLTVPTNSRFIINVPTAELSSVERICFQVEQAHWFYEDFIRELKPELPSFQLKTFSARNILFFSLITK